MTRRGPPALPFWNMPRMTQRPKSQDKSLIWSCRGGFWNPFWNASPFCKSRWVVSKILFEPYFPRGRMNPNFGEHIYFADSLRGFLPSFKTNFSMLKVFFLLANRYQSVSLCCPISWWTFSGWIWLSYGNPWQWRISGWCNRSLGSLWKSDGQPFWQTPLKCLPLHRCILARFSLGQFLLRSEQIEQTNLQKSNHLKYDFVHCKL